MTEKRKKGMPRRGEIFERRVQNLAVRSLEIKEARFAREQAGAGEDRLLAYLKVCIKELGHTPQPWEVIGGGCIAGRLGGWPKALRLVGRDLRTLKRIPLEKSLVYKRELQIQRYLLTGKDELVDSLYGSFAVRLLQSGSIYCMLLENPAARNGCIIRARRLALEEVRRQDEEFARRYGSAGDGELLGYLRERAAILGHTPEYDEVCGYRYLKERFGSLGEAERLAGLRPAPMRAESAVGENRRIAAEDERQRELYNRTLAVLDRRCEEFYMRNWDRGEEVLLAQLRAAADRLGRSPGLWEVIGGEYIRRRFGDWDRALKLAGLNPRTEAKAPWDSDLFREELERQKQAVLARLSV